MNPNTQAALERIRGTKKPTRPSVQRLAAFANVHRCPTATVAFAAGVDTNRLFGQSPYQMPFGQSPFAIGRGLGFEGLLRAQGHAELRRVLGEGLGADFTTAGVHNLRDGYTPDLNGLKLKAKTTKGHLITIAGTGGQVVIDGAVLRANVGGIDSYLEADEVAIGVNGQIVVGENKSWPIVDGRPTDPDAFGSALDQAATYILLTRRTLEAAGLDPNIVSGEAILITPTNTGLTPTLHRQDVEVRVRRARRLLDQVPHVDDIAAGVGAAVTFKQVGDTTLDADRRLHAFEKATSTIGRLYDPGSCLASCGFAWACRTCAYGQGDPAIAGATIVRAAPGITNLARIADLAAGATPNGDEALAAPTLERAGRLFDDALRRSA